ncbi:hypothetical protein JL37_19660 [Achromobacter sp. RTa]|uniref:hypothetical protein n=1 Tax=Achromobacter sp. RTa TaxID=1532557 RepID=UPI00050F9FEB|nr:hypothetical protein [Achromobacter sp. RTa]KGD90182.1 hypothetical protein JL37_19660 [Achromobacter sp. RTa]
MSGTSSAVCADLLTQLLANGDLAPILAGEPPCFVENRTGEDESQDVRGVFDRVLLPCWQSGRFPDLSHDFADALVEMISRCHDRHRAIYLAHGWIWYYRFCLAKKRANPQGPYGDLFEIDLGAAAATLKRELEANKPGLILDTRWAGAAWNSDNGLWGPLLRTAATVRDKLGGPDFVPDNA